MKPTESHTKFDSDGTSSMSSSLSVILEVRLLVGFLGERAQFAWWPTAFYESSSHLFLEPVFSKTLRTAQYHGVVEAARRLHDEHLSVGCYHLFRLPVEQDLHELIQSHAGGVFAGQPPFGKDAALDALKRLTSAPPSEGVGPTAVGTIKDLHAAGTAGSIAGVYCAAFAGNTKSYPYLVA
jgi:hypothetical protein